MFFLAGLPRLLRKCRTRFYRDFKALIKQKHIWTDPESSLISDFEARPFPAAVVDST